MRALSSGARAVVAALVVVSAVAAMGAGASGSETDPEEAPAGNEPVVEEIGDHQAEPAPPVEGADMATPWVYSPDEEIPAADLRARAEAEGITESEAEHRFRVDHAIGGLDAELAERYPDTFAGAWVRHDPFDVVVSFTEAASANVDELATTFPYPDELVAHTASRSLRDLEAIQDRLGELRERLSTGHRMASMPALDATAGRFDTNLDVMANVAVVHVDGDVDAVSDELAAVFGPGVIARRGTASEATCTSYWDCRWAMLAGLNITSTSTGGAACTSGFSVGASSARYMLTAGHCYYTKATGATYPHWHHSGSYYGGVIRYSISGNTDVALVRPETGFKSSSKFFVPGEYPRMVTSYISYANLGLNTFLYKTGRTTGMTSGYVKSKTYSSLTKYLNNPYDFILTDMCVAKGDSGGPVWRGNSAVGITSGAIFGDPCRGPARSDDGPLIFGAVDYAFKKMSVWLTSNENVKPIANFSHSCGTLMKCSFSGSGSTDEDGGVTSYTWSFGDGSTASGYWASHTYSLPGTYTVRVTVKDNNGAAVSRSKSIVVGIL